jgi:hypothetical protein
LVYLWPYLMPSVGYMISWFAIGQRPSCRSRREGAKTLRSNPVLSDAASVATLLPGSFAAHATV